MLKIKHIIDLPTWKGFKKITNLASEKWALGASLKKGWAIIKRSRVVRTTDKRS